MPSEPNPGGYIGEALAAIKPPRKPRPFSVRGCIVASCHVGIATGDRTVRLDAQYPDPREARRLAKWLAEAAEWMEAGNG